MNEPDWSLLPQHPQAFFELDDGFDQKTLKRAYNRLLKKYKPEKAPDEFKRLRRAYEDLDEQLRYGRQLKQQDVNTSYQWNADPPSDKATKAPNEDPNGATKGATNEVTKQSISIPELLKQRPAKTVYTELSQQPEKSPFEFYALALISDLVQKDRTMFFRWLATGLKAHPHDLGLSSLIRSYLASPNIPIQSLPQTLLTFSKVVDSDEFFFFTERAWKRLFRESDFTVFRKTLAACESNLKSFSIQNRLTFYLSLLRISIWKADPQWVQQIFKFVDENGFELGPYAEFELEFVNFLMGYRKVHQHIIGKDNTRREIHEAIVAWCDQPDSESDAKILSLIHRLATNGQLLLNAFPVRQPFIDSREIEPTESLFFIWQTVCEDVAERNGIVVDDLDFNAFTTRLYKMMKDLETDWLNSMLPTVCGWGNLLLYPIIAIILITTALFYIDGEEMIVQLVIGCTGMMIGYHYLIRPFTVDILIRNLYLRHIFSLYAKRWRGRFIQLVEASSVDAAQLNRGLFIVVQGNDLNASELLCQYVPRDVGLAFFSSVNRFRQ